MMHEDSLPPPPPFFEALLDASPDLFFFKDAQGIYRMVNRAFEELVDLPREAIVGQDDYGLFARPEAVRHQEADRQVLSTGQPATFEYCVNFRGQPVWLQVLKSPVRGQQGHVVGLFCTARDISDSKRNESDGQLVRVALEQRVADRTMRLRRANAKLRLQIRERRKAETSLAETVRTLNLILDNSPIGISFVVQRVVQWANPRFHALFARPAGSIAGQSTARFYPDNDSFETFGRLHYPQLAEGKRVDVIWPMRRVDGTDFFCRIIGQLLYPDRPQAGSIWLMEDVTERRLAEEAALAVERLKREFMDTMSHEIRTPLNGILGMTTLLADTSLSEEQQELVETLQEATRSLHSLLESILDFSRLENEAAPAPSAVFRLHDILDGVRHSLAGLAAHKRLTLTYRLAPDLPDLVFGDADGTRRVLMALVSNAIKFTEHGGVTVEVGKSESGSNALPNEHGTAAVTVLFAVADTGIGLTPEQLFTIFEPFRQVDGSHTRRVGGAGLGLAIARKTVEAMHGTIDVTSEYGKGSVFSFTVPFALPEAPPKEPRR
jgi:PAS domain S-box-containing protein